MLNIQDRVLKLEQVLGLATNVEIVELPSPVGGLQLSDVLETQRPSNSESAQVSVSGILALYSPVWQDIYNNSLADEKFQQVDGKPLTILDSSGKAAYAFECDRTFPYNNLRLSNGFGAANIVAENYTLPAAPQLIGCYTYTAWNSIGQSVKYARTCGYVANAGELTSYGRYAIELTQTVATGMVTYLDIDAETQTVKVPNFTSKVLDNVATLSDLVAQDSWQELYDNDPAVGFQLDGVKNWGVQASFGPSLFELSDSGIVTDLLLEKVDPIFKTTNIASQNPGANLPILLWDFVANNDADDLKSFVQMQWIRRDRTAGNEAGGIDVLGMRAGVAVPLFYFNSLQTAGDYIGTYSNKSWSSILIANDGLGIHQQSSTVGVWDVENTSAPAGAQGLLELRAKHGDGLGGFKVGTNIKSRLESIIVGPYTAETYLGFFVEEAGVETAYIELNTGGTNAIGLKRSVGVAGDITCDESLLLKGLAGVASTAYTQLPSGSTASRTVYTGVADGVFAAGDWITISSTTDYRYVIGTAGSDDPVIGVALSAGAVGQPFTYCNGGHVAVNLESTTGGTRKDYVRRSATENGKVEAVATGASTFGALLASAPVGASVLMQFNVNDVQ